MKKSILKRICNRLFHVLARNLPGARTLRPWFHRHRGVNIQGDVFIGDGVYIDNEYPEVVEIHDGAQISIRAMIVAHTRGPGKVIIEKDAFVGPNAVIACSGGRTLRIGEGAVVSAGCIVTKSVPARAVLVAHPPRVVGMASVPITQAKTMEEFQAGLKSFPVSPNLPKAGP